jgi:hypothetical protein
MNRSRDQQLCDWQRIQQVLDTPDFGE